MITNRLCTNQNITIVAKKEIIISIGFGYNFTSTQHSLLFRFLYLSIDGESDFVGFERGSRSGVRSTPPQTSLIISESFFGHSWKNG